MTVNQKEPIPIKNNAYPPPQESIENELVNRYRERLKRVYQSPSPYYQYPSWEAKEIQETIKKINNISKKVLS